MDATDDAVQVTISIPYRVWNYIGEILAYDHEAHAWKDVEIAIAEILTDIVDSDRESPER